MRLLSSVMGRLRISASDLMIEVVSSPEIRPSMDVVPSDEELMVPDLLVALL
jgi:hypothetical protein